MQQASPAQLDILTIAQAADAIGIKEWQLARTYERGFLPKPPKFGPYRVVRTHELPTITEAARRAGYLPVEAEAVSA